MVSRTPPVFMVLLAVGVLVVERIEPQRILDRALAEGRHADERRPAVILKRGGQHLGGRRRFGVHEDHQRDVVRGHAAVGRERAGIDLAQLALRGDNHACRKEALSRLNTGQERPAHVPAEIEDEGPDAVGELERVNRFVEFPRSRRCRCGWTRRPPWC
jgi:hypothetical protein